MTVDLQQTAIDPTDPAFTAALEDTQGNILQSHGRDFSIHLFLKFEEGNIAGARKWIETIVAGMVTTALDHTQAVQLRRANGTDAGLFTNFGLSADGYKALGITNVPDDPSFLRGAKNPAPPPPPPAVGLGLNDPPVSDWEPGFQGEIHAILMLADDSEAELTSAADAAKQALAGIATVVNEEQGAVLRNEANEPLEPFGFADGVSQPLFLASDLEKARMNGGLDRYDPSAPLGLVLVKDPAGGPNGYGSYFVYRKLEQDVEGFKKQEAELVAALKLDATKGDDLELAGAYVVGRFRDGTPVVTQPKRGWVNEPNNFNYDDDGTGVRCPFHAHARKANPRGDKRVEFGLPMSEDRSRRIARRAVPYPITGAKTPAGTPVGLLFVCAQSSIVDQFEFIQGIWANYTDFLRIETGLDGVIGQAPSGAAAVEQTYPTTWGTPSRVTDDSLKSTYEPLSFDFGGWVKLQGAEYFFLPSLSFLQKLPAQA
jgi:Dyp-type peroxidase family